MTEWTSATTWDEWEVLDPVAAGGQGVVTKARDKSTAQEGCLKTLSKQHDLERRARFAREAVAYDTCRNDGVPRLLQSNALHHEKLNYKLFIVTEFVPGDTLAKRINTAGPLKFSEARLLVVRLLETLAYLHDEGWVHRDVKPDNIILRENAVASPVLLDFGLCFRQGITESFETELGQELGNRFLRLPELAIGSEIKQDVRSDIAFAGGILFYVLTGTIPATLADEHERMPHQRPSALATLTHIGGNGAMALLGFFDQTFSPNPRGRYSSAQEALKGLNEAFAASLRVDGQGVVDDLDFVVDHVNRLASQRESETASKLDNAMQAIQAVHSEVGERIKPTYVKFFTGHVRIPKGVRYAIGFSHFERQEERFVPEFLIQAIGGEIVIRANGDVVYRTDLDSPVFNGRFSETVRTIFARGVRGLVEDPVAVVSERRYFKSKPLTHLEHAKTIAREQGRPLFLVIFDESSESFSNLDYLLGSFVRHRATKDLVDEHFVVAMVPSSQQGAPLLVPADDHLEEAIWVVLAPDGAVLVQEHLYPNADEGMKSVKKAIHLWETTDRPANAADSSAEPAIGAERQRDSGGDQQ